MTARGRLSRHTPNPVESTAIRTVILGPEMSLMIGGSLAANLGLDVPIDIDNTGLQTVPEYRVDGGFQYRF
jgi:hypothetical protein